MIQSTLYPLSSCKAAIMPSYLLRGADSRPKAIHIFLIRPWGRLIQILWPFWEAGESGIRARRIISLIFTWWPHRHFTNCHILQYTKEVFWAYCLCVICELQWQWRPVESSRHAARPLIQVEVDHGCLVSNLDQNIKVWRPELRAFFLWQFWTRMKWRVCIWSVDSEQKTHLQYWDCVSSLVWPHEILVSLHLLASWQASLQAHISCCCWQGAWDWRDLPLKIFCWGPCALAQHLHEVTSHELMVWQSVLGWACYEHSFPCTQNLSQGLLDTRYFIMLASSPQKTLFVESHIEVTVDVTFGKATQLSVKASRQPWIHASAAPSYRNADWLAGNMQKKEISLRAVYTEAWDFQTISDCLPSWNTESMSKRCCLQ